MRSLLVIFLLFSCSAFAKTITIKVNGLVCSLCSQKMKTVFEEQKEVKSVAVDLDKKTVTLIENPGKSVSDEKIKALIDHEGYDVDAITRE